MVAVLGGVSDGLAWWVDSENIDLHALTAFEPHFWAKKLTLIKENRL